MRARPSERAAADLEGACRLSFRLSVAFVSAVLIVAGGAAAADRPPNIVLIIGDDVGWMDYGFMGSEVVKTPNLDRLASGGAVFTHAFSTDSVCKPALRTLLTGQHPEAIERRLRRRAEKKRHRAPLRDLVDTLPTKLAERGYASFQGGKYWEGTFRDGGFTHGMTLTLLPPLDENGEREPPKLRSAAGSEGLALGRETMDPLFGFLDEHRNQPFFVWYAPMLPHMPFDAPAEFGKLYPPESGSVEARAYWSNMTRFDATVGALLERLEKLGLRDDTVVLYVSDNGWDAEGPQSPLLGGEKGKGSIHEIGFRTPLIASWPGHIAPGTRRDSIVSIADVYPTILDFAGVTHKPTPGMSLHASLLGAGSFDRRFAWGGSGTSEQREFFLRTQRWRYVQLQDATEGLYLIEQDPRENDDLAAEQPELLEALRAELEQRVRGARARGRAHRNP